LAAKRGTIPISTTSRCRGHGWAFDGGLLALLGVVGGSVGARVFVLWLDGLRADSRPVIGPETEAAQTEGEDIIIVTRDWRPALSGRTRATISRGENARRSRNVDSTGSRRRTLVALNPRMLFQRRVVLDTRNPSVISLNIIGNAVGAQPRTNSGSMRGVRSVRRDGLSWGGCCGD
jgi:hypothetical protein